MSLHLFDSHSGELREFKPLKAGQAGIYVCGPTVQSSPHVGHLRSALVFDQLRRWLEVKGLKVTLVRNVTDIDDKILDIAEQTGEQWWALAYRIEQEFNEAYRALRIAAPTYEPRATASIPEMLQLIERLIEAGFAYQAEDGSADVYFAAGAWPHYGELTRQKLEFLEDAEDADPRGKRDARDFAMWKSAKAGEPMWTTPWGPGRPGWHIECSAMAAKYLGESFDIHGGGLDLVFPHHENEIAQSKAAGDGFAQYWLHNAWVTTAGEKMSKSLGNSLLVDQVVRRVRPVELRYYLAGAHYRSMLEYSDEHVAEAGQGYRRIEGFLQRAAEQLGVVGDPVVRPEARPTAFDEAMDDDIAVPQALAVIHETVREGNAALANDDADSVRGAFDAVLAMVDVLGLSPYADPWRSNGGQADDRRADVIGALVQVVLDQRQEARARRDFAAADAIRDGLEAIGITVEDTATGVRWSLS